MPGSENIYGRKEVWKGVKGERKEGKKEKNLEEMGEFCKREGIDQRKEQESNITSVPLNNM